MLDGIEKQEAQPLQAYEIVTDLSVDRKVIPWDKQDPSEEALESISAEVPTSLLSTCKGKYTVHGSSLYRLEYCFACSSSFMEREECTRTPNCRNKVGKSSRKMAYCITVLSLSAILGEDLMSNY